jgi:hypothetical protein
MVLVLIPHLNGIKNPISIFVFKSCWFQKNQTQFFVQFILPKIKTRIDGSNPSNLVFANIGSN